MAKQAAEKAPKHEATTTGKPAAEKGGEASEGGSSAPRPRKYDYGIQPENKVAAVTKEEAPKLKAGEQEGYDVAKKGPLVKTFLEKSTRSVLRRLMRKGLVTITSADGTTYPRDYVAPPPKPKAEKKAKPEAA